jgi:hypothetical protein
MSMSGEQRKPLVPLASSGDDVDDDDDDDDDDGYSLVESAPPHSGDRSQRRRRPSGGGGDAAAAAVEGGGATILQTTLNVAKICTGTGTLALPYASERGGLLFNALGLLAVGAWNYYSANCLLRCAELISYPDETGVVVVVIDDGEEGVANLDGGSRIGYGTIEDSDGSSTAAATRRRRRLHHRDRSTHRPRGPPPGTTAYGAVAWHACGPRGLALLDALMLCVFGGIVVAYEIAMASFVNGTPLTTGSRLLDLLIPNAILVVLSCVPDVGMLGRHSSGLGLAALAASFAVASWRGYAENGFDGFLLLPRTPTALLDGGSGLWPESVSAASSWFGVVVFSFGVVPFVLNFR